MGGNDVWITAWVWSQSQLNWGWLPPLGLDLVKTNLVRSGWSSTSKKHLPSSGPVFGLAEMLSSTQGWLL